MFDNEEKELEIYRKKLEELPIDLKKIDDAILKGVQIGESEKKNAKRKRKRTFYSLAAAAMIILVFVTSIRVSPAFAKAVATIPGMARIVELIEYDKGIKAIVDHEYYQTVHASVEKDNLNLTIDGVVLDETGMILSYTLEAPYSIEDLEYGDIKLLHDGEEIPSGLSYNYPDQLHPNRKEDLIHFTFGEPQVFESQDFTLELELLTKEDTKFTIPFHVSEKIATGKAYPLHQEVEIEGQKLTIEKVTIYPLRVAVEVIKHPENTMELLLFEDLRIEDDKGEVWSKIQNGITSTESEDGRVNTYFLQSNYFEQPEKMYLKFNEMQALPKDDVYLVIDTNKKEVLKQPAVGNLEITDIRHGSIEGRFKNTSDFSYGFINLIENANGDTIDSKSTGLWHEDEDSYFNEFFEAKNIVNPLTFHIWAYPNYVEGNVEIELK